MDCFTSLFLRGTKQPIGVLKQNLSRKGVTELSDRPLTTVVLEWFQM